MATARGSGARWTVRDVSPALQRRAKMAADRAGMKLGAWVSAAVQAKVDAGVGGSAKGSGDLAKRVQDLERRVARLEKSAAQRAADGTRIGVPQGAAKRVEIDLDSSEFRELVRRLFVEKLHGAPPHRIREALGVSDEMAHALSQVRA